MKKSLALMGLVALLNAFLLIGTAAAQPAGLNTAMAPSLEAIPAPGSIVEFEDCNAFGTHGFGYTPGTSQANAIWRFENLNTWAKEAAEACCAHHGMDFFRYAFIPTQYINGAYYAGGPNTIVACILRDQTHSTK